MWYNVLSMTGTDVEPGLLFHCSVVNTGIMTSLKLKTFSPPELESNIICLKLPSLDLDLI
jgi:hypothetical protein